MIQKLLSCTIAKGIIKAQYFMPDWLRISLGSGWSSRGKWKSVYSQIQGIHFNLAFSFAEKWESVKQGRKDSSNWDTDTVIYKKVQSSVICCFKSFHVLAKNGFINSLLEEKYGKFEETYQKAQCGECSEPLLENLFGPSKS